MARFSKETVSYTDHAPGWHICGRCENFIGGAVPTCVLVIGPISRAGWCSQWIKGMAKREDTQ